MHIVAFSFALGLLAVIVGPRLSRSLAERSFARNYLIILKQATSMDPEKSGIEDLFMWQAMMWRQRGNLAQISAYLIVPSYVALCYMGGRWWPTFQLWKWGAIPYAIVIATLLFIGMTGKKLEGAWHEAALKALVRHPSRI